MIGGKGSRSPEFFNVFIEDYQETQIGLAAAGWLARLVPNPSGFSAQGRRSKAFNRKGC
jgi:hypothetical protein